MMRNTQTYTHIASLPNSPSPIPRYTNIYIYIYIYYIYNLDIIWPSGENGLHLSAAAVNLINTLLQLDPARRPTASGVL